MQTLLAVDLGVRTGLALYGGDGRLLRYRSQNFGSAARLRRALPALLEAEPDLAWLVIEGGGPLADAWEREAARRHGCAAPTASSTTTPTSAAAHAS
jgi:hypothetical protein